MTAAGPDGLPLKAPPAIATASNSPTAAASVNRHAAGRDDPNLGLIAGVYSAWQGAFLVSATGERIAIVGRFDAPSVEQLGAYEVIGYDESIRPALRETVERLAPRAIALNYSESDPAADGLTHGLWRVLQDTFADTYADRFVPSEAIVNALRGRKSPEEVDRIRGATRETEEIFDAVTAALRPDLSEVEIAGLMHAEIERRNLGYAWDRDHCPAVNAGPEKDVGHSPPGELRTRSGELLHVDFGVCRDDYCSDLQRVWYFLDDGEMNAPEDVRRAWERTGRRSTQASRCSARASRAGKSTQPRGRASWRRAIPSRCTRSAISSGARRMTAARCSRRAGIATAPHRSASSRRATCSRSSTARPCPDVATSGSRKTWSSRPPASSGSRRRSASSGSSASRTAIDERGSHPGQGPARHGRAIPRALQAFQCPALGHRLVLRAVELVNLLLQPSPVEAHRFCGAGLNVYAFSAPMPTPYNTITIPNSSDVPRDTRP